MRDYKYFKLDIHLIHISFPFLSCFHGPKCTEGKEYGMVLLVQTDLDDVVLSIQLN